MREILQRCAKLEHAVAVVFERRLFSTKDYMWPCTKSMKRHPDDVPACAQAQKIACGPLRTAVLYCTESMKQCADDGRTIHIYHISLFIAERLSARQLILHRISKMCICLSVSVSVHYILCACARGLRPTTC